MKKLFNRTLFVLCAVMLLISAVFAWAAAEEAATPTDLIPQEGELIPEEPGKESEPEGDGITSVEVVITKTLTVGQSWEGKMKKTKPAVLKLDVTRPGLVYMLVEGKDVWFTVEKSDRQTENPTRTKTDPETDRMVISWEAEEGSYLITLGPVEPNLLATAKVNFMDKQAYEAWEVGKEDDTDAPAGDKPADEPAEEPAEKTGETSQAEPQEPADEPIGEQLVAPQEEPNEEPADLPDQPGDAKGELKDQGEPENPEASAKTPEMPAEASAESAEFSTVTEPEQQDQNEPDSVLPEDRSIDVTLTWDSENPVLGDTAHLKATLKGYDSLVYTLQWQYSPDAEQWTDTPGETKDSIDIVTSEENNFFYWRILVYIEEASD